MESQSENNRRFLRSIYHEQQSGALCAVHAVNSVMQRKMWNEFQFADIAKGLDEQEHSVLESGERSKGSVNYDDSGFFSVQVVVRALKIGGISISHLMKPEEKDVRGNPLSQTAFICNHNKHWFAIRKFGKGIGSRWFNLNSTFKFPEFLSDTFLSLFLEQLITEGYAVFICRGIYPTCDADQYVNLFDHRTYISPRSKFLKKKIDYSHITDPREREQLRRAIELSKDHDTKSNTTTTTGGGGGFDDDLQRALEMSRREFGGGGGNIGVGNTTMVQTPKGSRIMKDEDDQIKQAIAMSLLQNNNNNNNNDMLPPSVVIGEGDDDKKKKKKESMKDEDELSSQSSDVDDIEKGMDMEMEEEDEEVLSDVDIDEAEKDDKNMNKLYNREERKAQLSQIFGSSDDGDGKGEVKIRFRIYNGKIFERKFGSGQSIGDLYDFLEFKFLLDEEYPSSPEYVRNELVIINTFPKVEMDYQGYSDKTLQELKFSGNIMFSVGKK